MVKDAVSPGWMTACPPPPVTVFVMVSGTGGVSATMLLTQVSAALSMALASPVTTQPPFASAFAIAVSNFETAALRQLGSAVAAPDRNAFCQQLAFAATFLTASLFLATAHFSAGV